MSCPGARRRDKLGEVLQRWEKVGEFDYLKLALSSTWSAFLRCDFLIEIYSSSYYLS